MNLRLSILFILLSALSIAYAAGPNETQCTQSEMYIKGFQENFNAMPSNQQKDIAKGIRNAGKMLEAVIDSADYFINQRNKRMSALKSTKVADAGTEYDINRKLLNEYIHFSFDSSFMVARKNLGIAQEMNNADKLAETRIDLANIFTQGGYFREAADCLDNIDMDAVADSLKIKALISRFNMEFENGFFFQWNLQERDLAAERMKELYPKIISMLPDDAYEIYQLRAKMAFYKHQYTDATGYCDILLLKNNDPNNWNYINALGDMGYCKMGSHEYVEAMDYMVKSATLAIRQGALNNPAMRKIAELLFVAGNNRLASGLINRSMDNAMAYNSKYRIIESAKGYPMINRQLHEQIERDRRNLIISVIVMALLVVVLALSLWHSRKQHNKIKQQAIVISKYNKDLKQRNEEIEAANHSLNEIHGVTAILTSKMMKGASLRRELLDKLYKNIALKVKVKQYADIPDMVESTMKELKSLRTDIDEILLAFFPNFVEQFNKLLKEEARFSSAKGTLPTEVRIFALWRIGVKKNEDIARCMDYSLNTIKSYKTRVINSSLYEKEEFYERLMQIKVNVKE